MCMRQCTLHSQTLVMQQPLAQDAILHEIIPGPETAYGGSFCCRHAHLEFAAVDMFR